MGIKADKARRAQRQLEAMRANDRRFARLEEALAEARATIDQKDRELVEKDRQIAELRAELAKPRGAESAPASWTR